jgi:hypothetical protein
MEIAKPNIPTTPKPIITIPKGKCGAVSTGASGKVGMDSGTGGVKVGKRVSVGLMLKVAIMDGSSVETVIGVNVGGGSMIGGAPFKVT